jgi:hypothetical protein
MAAVLDEYRTAKARRTETGKAEHFGCTCHVHAAALSHNCAGELAHDCA